MHSFHALLFISVVRLYCHRWKNRRWIHTSSARSVQVRMGVSASRLQLGNPCCHRNDRFSGVAGLIQCRVALVPRSVFSSSICSTCVHSPNLAIFSLIGVQPGPITLLVMGKTINHWAWRPLLINLPRLTATSVWNRTAAGIVVSCI